MAGLSAFTWMEVLKRPFQFHHMFVFINSSPKIRELLVFAIRLFN